jgi:hypothetical protein
MTVGNNIRILRYFAVVLIAFAFTVIGFGQRTTKERPLPKSTPSVSPTPAKVAPPTIERLTSVSQVIDVKPADVHFEALRSLIERYGIGGLTRDKRFNGNANLTGSDLSVIDKDIRRMAATLLVGIDAPAEEIKKYEPRTCPIDTKRLTFTEKAVADHLHCSYHPAVLDDLKPTAAILTRSRYVIFLDEILDALMARVSELEAKALKAREDAKKAAATPTPTPKPPIKLVELSNRPGDFWNFIPGTWEADLTIGDKKSPRSRWKFSQRRGNDFTLTLDVNSTQPTDVRVWAVKKTPIRFGDPEYHTINFDYSGYRFDGYIIVGGALKGNISQNGRSVGTWAAYRRVDIDYANLGAEAAKRKSNDEAIGYYSKAIEIKPLSDHLLNRGNLYYAERQYEQAVADYSQAIRFGASSEAHYNRSLAYYNLKRYRESADDATTILTKFIQTLSLKRRADAYVQRGRCHIGLNERNAAIADFREALRNDPSSEKARKALIDMGVQP